MAKHTQSYLAYVWEFLRNNHDRRAAQRYAANPHHKACLAWLEGDRHQAAAARIIDLSQTGAQVQVEALVPRSGPVWLRLTAPQGTEWQPATIVETKASRFKGTSQVRLRFARPCPYDFFKASINGFQGPACEGFMSL